MKEFWLEKVGAHWTVKQVSGENRAQCGWEVTLGEEVENSGSEVFVKDEESVEVSIAGAHWSVEKKDEEWAGWWFKEKTGGYCRCRRSGCEEPAGRWLWVRRRKRVWGF